MTLLRPALAGLLAAAAFATQAAEEARPSDFGWRATLDTSGQHGLLRVPLPADALAHLQTRDAADLRVFDAQGQPVAFALATPPRADSAPRRQTAPLRALPLHATPAGAQAPRGTVQMRVQQDGRHQSVWVQLGDGTGGKADIAGSTRLPAALFDTRQLTEPLGAIVVRARLPANVPVRFTLSASADLASWTPVPVRGRVYRFEGDGAPANDTLELAAPLRLEKRYLRLDWSGHEGVAVEAITGLVAASEPPRERPALALPAPATDGAAALEWQLGFATPIASLALTTERPNTLVPVRVSGRNQPSEPWRLLGQAVVYRLGAAGQETSNPPLALHGASVRWVRVEATHGMRLDGLPLAARVLFEPVEVVFAAGGAAPYQLAAGRKGTAAAALPLPLLAATTSTRVEALPVARIAAVEVRHEAAPPWQQWLPRGVDGKTAGLWLVLVLGVLLLGGVAWSLLRQVDRPRG